MDSKLKQLLQRMAQAEVEMVLVGGYAAIFHGSSLMTEDVDVALNMKPENLERLYHALDGLHLRHRVGMNERPFEERDARDPNWRNLYLITDLGQLDCLGEVKGVGNFQEVQSKSDWVILDELNIQVLKIDALINAKNAIGRPKDIHAVRELEAIQKLREQQDISE